ncbi:hypothetical protein [Treponema sp. UBA3813]|uniref:hypothetical protein n=1 Tax=Treponema sp. UBA3813 TaxID=1947715 RepID=UPI0025ED6A60|nr:hypothetical protein [Treponema sp. UBA3813]
MAESETNLSSDAWYAFKGPENDVVLSTRVRLARNLANFPFPGKFKDDDAFRVQTLVFDSFSHCQEPDKYQGVVASELDELGALILEERGVLDSESAKEKGSGIIVRTDGKVSCAINSKDHVRLASFVPGLDGNEAFSLCAKIDDELQNTMQFAADYDFGYLTSSLNDCGSGMKVSCRLHLPSLSFSGRLLDLFSSLSQKEIIVSDCFGTGTIPSSSLGFYYQISTKTAGNGTELDQIASLVSSVKYLVENERRERNVVLRSRQTELRNRIYRSYAKVKYASLISDREAIEIISDIKWGKNLGFFAGIEDSELCALLYRVQKGHLQFVLKNRKFNFPVDISESKSLKTDYLRALILQEAFENIKLN